MTHEEPIIFEGDNLNEWIETEFVGLTEIIDLLAKHPTYKTKHSKQQVFNLAKQAGFPSPILILSMGRIWLASRVNEWADRQDPTAKTTTTPTGRPPLHGEDTRRAWRVLHAAGESNAEIASKFGVHASTVSRALRKEVS